MARLGKKKLLHGCLLVLVLGGVVLYFSGFGGAVRDLVKVGYLQALLSPEQQRKYDATTTENLKAIYTALMLHHDSEGQFPEAAKWMDAIQNRIKASDMSQEEAMKKLIRPDLLPAKPGVFGYALNDAVGGKYKGDLKDPKTVLVYESKDTTRNAHGDPKTAKGKMAITISGTVVRL